MLDVEVREVLLDIRRSLAKSDALPDTLSLTANPGTLREPAGVVTDGSALVQIE